MGESLCLRGAAAYNIEQCPHRSRVRDRRNGRSVRPSVAARYIKLLGGAIATGSRLSIGMAQKKHSHIKQPRRPQRLGQPPKSYD